MPDLLKLLIAAQDNEHARQWLRTHPLTHEDINWLISERLAPFLFQHIRYLRAEDLVSFDVLSSLRLEYIRSAAQNVLLATEMLDLLADLQAVGVHPIVLKGMALGILVYPSLATRPMGDLDLLVKKEQVGLVKQVFTSRAYHYDKGLEPGSHVGFPAHLHAWREYHDGRRIVVEAHWHLFHGSAYRNLVLDSWWERARTISYDGCEIRVFDPVDQLIHACAHLMLHHATSWNLVWLLDLRLLIDRNGEVWDWDAVVERVRSLHLSRSVHYYLSACQQWFGSCVPGFALEALSRDAPDAEERHYLHIAESQRPFFLQMILQRARGLGVWRAPRAYFQNVFPPWTYMQYRYGAGSQWMAPIYYLKRLARGVEIAFKRPGEY